MILMYVLFYSLHTTSRMVINVDNSHCYIAGNCFPAVHDLIGHFKVTRHLTIKPFPVKTSEWVKLQNAMQWGLMNFQLYNNSPEDWSLGKQLILFPSNLNVFLVRQDLKLFPSGSVMKCLWLCGNIWNCGMRFNAQQFSVTDVGRYICLDNSTLCNFMLHVCWIYFVHDVFDLFCGHNAIL